MAWDDVKPNGAVLTGPEYNAMVADQKARIPATEKGAANGVATLDEGGDVPADQLGNATKSLIGLGNVTDDAQIPLSQKGVAGGVATLDESGQVPLSQLGNAPEGSGSGEVDIDSLREKLSAENMDFILIEDYRTGTQMKVRVGNLANIRR